jgi:demethylmenaquinone methyltransferase/2-methoxy-6-polyprenyl-1,4-benzoquinol methylase
MKMIDEDLLSEQLQYYRERAREYDQWFFREGRYDRGPEHRDQWFGELAVVEAALAAALPQGHILELACGTGLWTRRLAGAGRRIMAVDAAPEAIALNRERLALHSVEYVEADLFSWVPSAGAFDMVFFAFWLSHVPQAKFDAFWDIVKTALKPDGVAFFVDSLLDQASTAVDHDALDTSGVVQRRLNDGRTFRVVKQFYEPALLEREMVERGWTGSVRTTGRFFLYGSMTLVGQTQVPP